MGARKPYERCGRAKLLTVRERVFFSKWTWAIRCALSVCMIGHSGFCSGVCACEHSVYLIHEVLAKAWRQLQLVNTPHAPFADLSTDQLAADVHQW